MLSYMNIQKIMKYISLPTYNLSRNLLRLRFYRLIRSYESLLLFAFSIISFRKMASFIFKLKRPFNTTS